MARMSAHEITADELDSALGVVQRMPVEDQVYMFGIPERPANSNDGLAYVIVHYTPEYICRTVKKYRRLYRQVNREMLQALAAHMGLRDVYSMCKTYKIP